MAALSLFKRVQSLATAAGDQVGEATALLGQSGCYIRLFRYREALAASDDAFRLTKDKDHTVAGAAAGNKATIYLQVGDSASALEAIDQAVTLLKDSARQDNLARALLTAGDIQTELNRSDRAFPLFRRSIATSQIAHLPSIEAMAQDHLGVVLLQAGDPTGAEKALLAARWLYHQTSDVENEAAAKEDLADLYLVKKQYATALHLIDEVLGSTRSQSMVQCWPLQLRGKILLSLGKQQEALTAFGQAVAAADSWREGVLVSDATRIHTVVSISSIYQDYIDLAAKVALQRGDQTLSRRALQVLIASRAWSLKQEMLAAYGRTLMLPPRYYELLSQLQSTQALVTLGGNGKVTQANESRLQNIRLQLADLQNGLGLPSKNFSPKSENPGAQTSLRDIQRRLSNRQLLLSYSVSNQSALVWTVTRNQVHLYELPNSAELGRRTRAFSAAVERDAVTPEQGKDLSRTLFGPIPASARALPEWLIAANGPLLDSFPFSALPDLDSAQPAYVFVSHAMRLIASEALLASPSERTQHEGFLGIADPIYNLADSRRATSVFRPVRQEEGSQISLSRLVGSEAEARGAAAASGTNRIQILTGSQATIRQIQSALVRRPALIHFAVHVITPSAAADGVAAGEAALALSLTSTDFPELLTKESIASLRVPGSLIVLSGCASQQGQVLPGAGIVGLSRAWLIAGASAVLVTAWPTPDDSGHFFQSFYTHFRTATGTVSERAGSALQNAQSEMRATPGYRSKASYWSAYSLISKE